MTITEISTMLVAAAEDLTKKKVALDKAKEKYELTIAEAEKEYGAAAHSHDLALEKARVLRNNLNTELEKLSPSLNINTTGRVRGAA